VSPSASTSTTAPAARRISALSVPAAPWDAITAWALSFGLVFYLALRGGAYDAVIRDQVAILIWWVVVLAAVAGLMPRLTRRGWAAVALLAAWAIWTAIGIPGSESAERTLTEVGRISAYVGVLLLALTLQGRAGSRHIVNGVASAIGLITAMAVLSRLHPQWFPANDQLDFLPTAARRLSYPLNYWNGLAGFMAMGAVLLLGVAATARTRAGQFVAAAAVPLSGLGTYLCVSRGGAIVFVIGLVTYFLLTYDRLAKLATLVVALGGTLILVDAATQRDAIQTGIDTAAARSEGTEMIWLCLIVCAGVGACQVAINLLARHTERPAFLRPSRRTTAIVFAAALVLGLIVFFGAGINHDLADKFREFKTPPAPNDVAGGDVFSRLQGTAGQGRWQFWQVAVDAYHTAPWHGIGAGTFEFFWDRNATIDGKVIDAHNLYVQTLAELGLPGIFLLGCFVALTVVSAAVMALRETGTARTLLAAATAAIVIFWVQAAAEWTWQIGVMPITLMFLVAVAVGHGAPRRRSAPLAVRAAVVLAGIAAFIPIAIGLSTTQQVRESQAAAQDGRLVDAMNAAKRADGLPGTSGTAILQEALVLEQAGALGPAREAAVRATQAEPTNWRPWLVRSRLEARLGETDAALNDFRTARSLDPRSSVFR